MKSLSLYRVFLLLVSLVATYGPVAIYAQSEMRVVGHVESVVDGLPIKGVAIEVADSLHCYSDVDGNFMLMVPRDCEISFSHPYYYAQTLKLRGRQQISAQLEECEHTQQAPIIERPSVKRRSVATKQGKIAQRGDYLYLETKYYIPLHLFKSDHRFIAQPVVVNRTQGSETMLRPVVVDGERYPLIQDRWLRFGQSVDSLAQFVVEDDISAKSGVYSYCDSVLVDKSRNQMQDDYYSKCYLAIVTYREPPIFVDTMTIARGLIDPARHFEYSARPMLLDQTTLAVGAEPYLIPTGLDTIYIPNFELKLQSVSGEAKVIFDVNRSSINLNNRQNSEEISKVRALIEELQDNPNAAIKSISISGYASPEGIYAKNKELAQERTDEVLRLVSSTLEEQMLRFVELKAESYVESWESVAKLAEGNHPELAATLRSIIALSGGSFDVATSHIVRLPEYRSVIVPNYLDDLRRVTYNIEFSIYKPLSYPAIKERYMAGEPMTRYQYYKLIAGEENPEMIPTMERQALEAYPNFTIFANRKAVNLLREDKCDLKLLEPLLGDDAPMPIIYNQALMAIKCDSLFIADSLTSLIAHRPEAAYLASVAKVLHSDYEGAYPYFEGAGTLNEAVLLLTLDRDGEAFKVMESIIERGERLRAKDYYIYATAANRIGRVEIALEALQQAIDINPEYEKIVQRDGDLLEIYEILVYQQKF